MTREASPRVATWWEANFTRSRSVYPEQSASRCVTPFSLKNKVSNGKFAMDPDNAVQAILRQEHGSRLTAIGFLTTSQSYNALDTVDLILSLASIVEMLYVHSSGMPRRPTNRGL